MKRFKAFSAFAAGAMLILVCCAKTHGNNAGDAAVSGGSGGTSGGSSATGGSGGTTVESGGTGGHAGNPSTGGSAACQRDCQCGPTSRCGGGFCILGVRAGTGGDATLTCASDCTCPSGANCTHWAPGTFPAGESANGCCVYPDGGFADVLATPRCDAGAGGGS
jgi:hypothetical protein